MKKLAVALVLLLGGVGGDCSTCARTAAKIREVVTPYGPRVALRTVDDLSDEGNAAAQRFGFASHGLGMTDDRHGRSDLVERAYNVYPDHVASALQRLLPN